MKDIATKIRSIKEEFAKIGANIQIIPFTSGSVIFKNEFLKISISEDERGEFFDLMASKEIVKNMNIVYLNSEEKIIVIQTSANKRFICGIENGNLFVAKTNNNGSVEVFDSILSLTFKSLIPKPKRGVERLNEAFLNLSESNRCMPFFKPIKNRNLFISAPAQMIQSNF